MSPKTYSDVIDDWKFDGELIESSPRNKKVWKIYSPDLGEVEGDCIFVEGYTPQEALISWAIYVDEEYYNHEITKTVPLKVLIKEEGTSEKYKEFNIGGQIRAEYFVQEIL